jgi:hypothetical protein
MVQANQSAPGEQVEVRSLFDKPHSPERFERRVRQGSAWLVLYLLLQAELGLAWDRNWHMFIGRDRFWIPPHVMMYTGLGGAGLVALTVVLLDTIRYVQKRPGVSSASTITICRIFHAPLGFTLVGFGALIDLAAAPFDNYWHILYGIDVTLWSPFHVMGTIGGVLTGIGLTYAFASEAVITRRHAGQARRFAGLYAAEWGTLLMLAAFIEVALPPLSAFVPIPVGATAILTYPLCLTLAGHGTLAAALRFTRRSSTMFIVVFLLCVLALGTQLFVPWALSAVAPPLGFTFRDATYLPSFNVVLALLPLMFLLCALCTQAIVFWHTKTGRKRTSALWSAGLVTAGLAVFLPPFIAWIPQLIVPSFRLPPDMNGILHPTWMSLCISLPFAFAMGAFSTLLGAGVGDIWHLNER